MILRTVSIDNDGSVRVAADGPLTCRSFKGAGDNPLQTLLGSGWSRRKILLDLRRGMADQLPSRAVEQWWNDAATLGLIESDSVSAAAEAGIDSSHLRERKHGPGSLRQECRMSKPRNPAINAAKQDSGTFTGPKASGAGRDD